MLPFQAKYDSDAIVLNETFSSFHININGARWKLKMKANIF